MPDLDTQCSKGAVGVDICSWARRYVTSTGLVITDCALADAQRIQLGMEAERDMRHAEIVAEPRREVCVAFYEGRKFQIEHPDVPLG